MKKRLTDNERKTYEFIRSRIQQGYPPSVREICAHCGFRSTSTAHRMVAMLTEKGYLEKADHLNRALRLPERNTVKVPLLGRSLTIDDQTSFISFAPEGEVRGELFAVKAAADLPEFAILEGDIIIAETAEDCKQGDKVVFIGLDGCPAVRKFTDGDSKPMGKARGVIRNL